MVYRLVGGAKTGQIVLASEINLSVDKRRKMSKRDVLYRAVGEAKPAFKTIPAVFVNGRAELEGPGMS